MKKLLMILFFGVFLAAGVGFFVFAALPMISTWQAAKTWVQAPAQLISQQLKIDHSDDSTTYQAMAEYHYQAFGNRYTSTRVAVSDGNDNIGSFQQDLARRLRIIADNGGHFTVWVNPDQPSDSLIDRSLRISLLLFYSIFLLAFGGVGAGGMVYTVIKAKKHQELVNVDPSSPWLSKQYWANPTILSNSNSGSMGMGVFALAWSVVSLAPLLVGIRELQAGNELALIAFIFPAIGLGLSYYWIKLRQNLKATGVMPLTLDPYPGSIGGQLGGTIKLANKNPSELLSSEVIAACILTEEGSDNDNNTTSFIWQDSMVPAAKASAEGTEISFCFDLPANLPESTSSDRMPHTNWKLSLSLGFQQGFKIDREYVDLPVFETATQSHFLSKQAFASHSAATLQAHNAAVDKIINVQQDSHGYRLYYPPGQQKWWLALSLFGLIFVQIGLTIPDLTFNVIFPAIGSFFAVLGFYLFAKALDVRIGAEGITSTRTLLGITIRTRFIPSFSFTEFREKKTHSSSSGRKHTQYYSIIAHGQDKQQLVVAEGLKSKGEAQAAIEKLNQLQGY
ncbi:MAG: hypothetical protein ACI8PV_000034 [Dinoroseobacter sp.]|jgi:hypothetical protein